MKLKRYLALILILCMFTSVMPYSAMAEEGQAPAPSGDVLPGEQPGELPELPDAGEELPPPDTEDPSADTGDIPVEPAEPSDDPAAPGELPEDTDPSEEPAAPPQDEEPSGDDSELPSGEDTDPAVPDSPDSPADEEKPPVFYNDSYSTLQEAIDAIGSGTITLTADPLGSAGHAGVGEDSDIVIDLNGHMLMDADIENRGTLTICDSGNDGQFMGAVVNRGHCEFSGDSHESYAGVLNIESGEILDGLFILEVDRDAPLHGEDASPEICVTGGRFLNVSFSQRYVYDDNGSLRYEDASDCGEVTVTGGLFLADPSSLLSDDYAAVRADDGFYEVVVKDWEDELPQEAAPVEEDSQEEEEVPASDDQEAQEDPAEPDGTEAPADDAEAEADVPEEAAEPEEPEEKTIIDLDLYISQGEGTVIVDGEEYTEDASIQVAMEDAPVLTIVPGEDFEVGNVYLGLNGSSTAYYGIDEIALPVGSTSYITATVLFNALEKKKITFLKGYETGSADIIQVDEPEVGEQWATLGPQQREGYTFHSWYCETDGSEYEANKSFTVMMDMTFKAKWDIDEYKINYHYNNPDQTDNSETYTIESGEITYKKPNSRTGYIFCGWYKDAAFSGDPVEKQPAGSTGDVDLYARWEKEYTVSVFATPSSMVKTITLNGSTVSSGDSEKMPEGSSAAFKLDINDDYYIEKITVNDVDITPAESFTLDNIKENKTVKIYLTEKTPRTVTYYDENDNILEQVNTRIKDTIKIKSDVTPKTGYDFIGWKDKETQSVSYAPDSDYTVIDDMEFIVEWKAIEYHIEYVMNGGTNETGAPVKYTIEDDEIVLPVSPVKSGAAFVGWFTESDFAPASQITSIPAHSTGDVTVYAKWTQVYKITYVANGGTVPADAPKTYTSLSPDITLPTPTKTDSTFLGWYTDKNFSDSSRIFEIPQGSTGDVTVYAKWEKYYKVSVYYTKDGVAYYQNRMLASGESFEIKEGEKATVRFVATTSKYQVYNVTVNNRRLGSVGECTVGPATEDYLINCTFAPDFMHPITGDDSHLGMWAAVMAFSALAATAVITGKKRKKEE